MSKIDEVSKKLHDTIKRTEHRAAMVQAQMKQYLIEAVVKAKQYEKIVDDEQAKLSAINREKKPEAYEKQLLVVKDKQIKYQLAQDEIGEYKAGLAESGKPDDGYLKA